jgi:hypothetical protein
MKANSKRYRHCSHNAVSHPNPVYREAVTKQSPGLPGFDGYPGNVAEHKINPNGVAPLTLSLTEIRNLN